MDENRQEPYVEKTPPEASGEAGKRVLPGRPKKKWPWIAAACVVLALVGGYLGLCAGVSGGGTALPNVTVMDVDLGGMTADQAAQALAQVGSPLPADAAVTVSVEGLQGAFRVPVGDALVVDAAATAQEALAYGRADGFLASGAQFLGTFFGGHAVDPVYRLSDAGQASLDAMLAQMSSQVSDQVVQTSWKRQGDDLVFTLGKPGMVVDRAELETAIFDRAVSGDLAEEIRLIPVSTQPDPVDLSQVRQDICTPVKDASMDKTTFDILESVEGVEFDDAAAQKALAGAPWGTQVSVPLAITQPKVTTESLRELLFRDVLGEHTSTVSGIWNRKQNVAKAAKSCTETILLPGEVFSYTEHTGRFNAANGYLPAPTYQNGQTVQETGGGACQPSSTLYCAVLNANLEIVERHNHSFAVGYVPDGMDATVWYGSLDFRFKNNTDYPIKVVAISPENLSTLTMKIYGTNLDGSYVKMTNEVTGWVSKDPVYQPDETMEAGAAPVRVQSAYQGRKATTYRNVYDKSGNLISSTLEAVSSYQSRPAIYKVPVGYTPEGAASPTPSVDPNAPVVDPNVPVDPTAPAVTDPAAPVDPGVPATPSPVPDPDPAVPVDPSLPTDPSVPTLPAVPTPAPVETVPGGDAPPAGIPVL